MQELMQRWRLPHFYSHRTLNTRLAESGLSIHPIHIHVKCLFCVVRIGWGHRCIVVLSRKGSPASRMERALSNESAFLCVRKVALQTCLTLAQTLSTLSSNQPSRYLSISLLTPCSTASNSKAEWVVNYLSQYAGDPNHQLLFIKCVTWLHIS